MLQPAELEALAQELSTVSDELQREIEVAEIALDALDLRVPAEVQLDPDHPGRALLYKRNLFIREPNGEEHRLASTGLKTRVQASTRLDVLFEAILGSSQDRIEEVRRATARTRAFNDRIRGLIDDEIR